MKITQDKKKEIRRNLVRAAVELFSEKGFRKATMKEISIRAGYGAATIYNYFPNKEKLLYGYFVEKQSDMIEALEEIPDFDSFHLKEKLQIHIETLLDFYLQDREFVDEAYRLLLDSPLRTFSEFQPIKQGFTNMVKGFIDEAVAKEEIPAPPLPGLVINLYWDYMGLLVFYWLKDDSAGFANTSVLIDLSLDIIVSILKSGLLSKAVDMAVFLFKSHLYGNVENHSSSVFVSPGSSYEYDGSKGLSWGGVGGNIKARSSRGQTEAQPGSGFDHGSRRSEKTGVSLEKTFSFRFGARSAGAAER